jgi:hypothetical protein
MIDLPAVRERPVAKTQDTAADPAPQPFPPPKPDPAAPAATAPPATDRPATDRPAAEQPAAEQPAAEQPATVIAPAVSSATAAPAAPVAAAAPEATAVEQGLDAKGEVTVVPGVPRYHSANCILIRFMGENDLEKTTRAQARQNGCTPCRACLPDQPEKPTELGARRVRPAAARTSGRDRDLRAPRPPAHRHRAHSPQPVLRGRPVRRARSVPRPRLGRSPTSAARSGR